MTVNILVIDDEEYIRDLLTRILEQHNYQCFPAESAAQARQIMAETEIDLILCDILMPEESGLDFISKIIQTSPETAAIIITAVDEPFMAEKAIGMGVYDYMTKPLEVNRVLVSVANALRRKQLEKANRQYQEELELMVRERTAELEEAKQELESAFAELQSTQTKIVQFEKMAAIGQISAGIAHEINNPTGYVISNLNTLKKYMERVSELISRYQEVYKQAKKTGIDELISICDAIDGFKMEQKIDYVLSDIDNLISESVAGMENIKRIVADLKLFVRTKDDEPQKADLNAGLESTINIVWNELKYKCTVEKEFASLPLTICRIGELSQVFMNLLLNAADAIKDKGVIKVATRFIEQTHGILPDAETGFIEISIGDSGTGIDPDEITKIFEPFFTTKDAGKGTGLGLSISLDIVKKHKGEITVKSEPGKGTVFNIYLPVVQ